MRPFQILVLCFFAVSIVVLHLKLKHIETSTIPVADVLPDVSSVKRFSLGYDHVLADYYWLKFVSYIGDTKARLEDHGVQSEHYIDLITTLDPNFVQAYWFGAFTIGGEQKNPRRAAELIERGISANQDSWYLPFIAGINQFLYQRDDRRAAWYYRQAAKFPDAPSWLERQAVILESDAPKLVKLANNWFNIYKSSSDARLRESAREKSIFLWVKVLKIGPNDDFRKRARQVLSELSVDPDTLH